MSEQADWKTRLAPFNDKYAALMEALMETVQGATPDELLALMRDAGQASRTNCGWTMYRTAQLVREEAASELYSRESDEAVTQVPTTA